MSRRMAKKQAGCGKKKGGDLIIHKLDNWPLINQGQYFSTASFRGSIESEQREELASKSPVALMKEKPGHWSVREYVIV